MSKIDKADNDDEARFAIWKALCILDRNERFRALQG